MINTVRLSNLVELNPRTRLHLNDDAPVSFIPMSGIDENGGGYSEEERTFGEVKKGYTPFESGDLLLAKITPCMENGKVALLNGLQHACGFGSTEFHVLRPGPDLDPRYLFHFIWRPKFRFYAEKNMTGSGGQKRVPAVFLEELEIPVPPLQEQRRIAAILDKADAIRRKRRQALAEVDALVRATFLDMFGDPTRLDPEESLKLSDVASIARGRFSPRPRNDPRFYGGPYPFIQTGDIAAADGYLTTHKQTLNEMGLRISKLFEPGTVLIAIVGATIGKTAIAGKRIWCPDSVIGIVPRSDVLTAECVEYLLRFWRPVFLESAPETARANINIETLRPVPVPKTAEVDQKKFAGIYRLAYRLRRQFRMESDELLASLSQRAFRGEL